MKIFIEKKYTNFSLVLKAILLHIYVTACTSYASRFGGWDFGGAEFDNLGSKETEKTKEWANNSSSIGLSNREFQRRNFFVSTGEEEKEEEEREKLKDNDYSSYIDESDDDLEKILNERKLEGLLIEKGLQYLLEENDTFKNEFIAFLEKTYYEPNKSSTATRTERIYKFIEANQAKFTEWPFIDLKNQKSQLEFYCKDQEKTSRLILVFPYNKKGSTFLIKSEWYENETKI